MTDKTPLADTDQQEPVCMCGLPLAAETAHHKAVIVRRLPRSIRLDVFGEGGLVVCIHLSPEEAVALGTLLAKYGKTPYRPNDRSFFDFVACWQEDIELGEKTTPSPQPNSKL
jgi:hypothetical protein